MIKKILKLNNIGRFPSLVQEKNFQYGENGQNCNIIFGFNGSGKTTISNAISFFSDNLFIDEDEKKEIYDDIKNEDNAIVEMSLQSGSLIKYPATNKHSKEIYIFNSHFVATHVFNGTKGKLKKFSNIGGEIKNKEIDTINEQITEFEKEKGKLDKENEGFDEKHKDITKTKSKNFGKSLTDKNKSIQIQNLLSVLLPTKTIKELENNLEKLITDYDLSKKQTELKTDLDNLRETDFSPKVEFELTDIDSLLSKNVQQLSKEVLEKKITEIQNLFKDESYKQSTEKWLRYGKDVLKKIDQNTEKICPICDTDITHKFDNLLSDYDGYFDDTYDKFIKDLNEKAGALAISIALVEKCELDADKLEVIFNKYKKLLINLSFEKYDFTQIKADLEELKTNLKSKNDNIQQNFSKPLNISNNITETNSAISDFEILKTSILDLLESKKLNTNTIEDKIRDIYKALMLLEFDQVYKSGALAIYKSNSDRTKIIITNEIPTLRKKLTEEIKKIKAESKSISKYLIKMGITNFDIDINEEQEDENIIIKYENSNNEKNKLKNSLSAGEKTALAFAYFLSKFENEINTDDKIKNSTVIIDDPISSLDENRLYSTAYLIHKNFENVKQLIVLSHNFLFLKHFNSLSKKPQCFFLDQNKILELPEELRNFETPYFYMLRNLFDFNNGNIEYNEVKKYMPNYIRRILETFLSFKFSRIVNRSGGNRSPGLADFDDNIVLTDLNDEVKEEIREKITSINSICDAHSHGNAHHTQENFYISEVDLGVLAKNAVYIIETMDKLHQTSFIGNNED